MWMIRPRCSGRLQTHCNRFAKIMGFKVRQRALIQRRLKCARFSVPTRSAQVGLAATDRPAPFLTLNHGQNYLSFSAYCASRRHFVPKCKRENQPNSRPNLNANYKFLLCKPLQQEANMPFTSEKNDTTFKSMGHTLAAHLYTPEGFDQGGSYPAVVISSAFNQVKEQTGASMANAWPGWVMWRPLLTTLAMAATKVKSATPRFHGSRSKAPTMPSAIWAPCPISIATTCNAGRQKAYESGVVDYVDALGIRAEGEPIKAGATPSQCFDYDLTERAGAQAKAARVSKSVAVVQPAKTPDARAPL